MRIPLTNIKPSPSSAKNSDGVVVGLTGQRLLSEDNRNHSARFEAFRIVCSPDGAKRNPGTALPHYAALHAGYRHATAV
jgi:hypothetical protein